MANLEIHQYPTRSDNYGVLIHDPKTEATAAIDAPDAEELLAALHEKGWVLTHVLTTHHHHDHTAGNTIVKRMTGCTIVGPAKEAGSIPGIDVPVKEGDRVEIGSAKARVIETPGHTRGHVSYHFPDEKLVFVGDTLIKIVEAPRRKRRTATRDRAARLRLEPVERSTDTVLATGIGGENCGNIIGRAAVRRAMLLDVGAGQRLIDPLAECMRVV